MPNGVLLQPPSATRVAKLGEHARAIAALVGAAAVLFGGLGAAAAHVTGPSTQAELRTEISAGDALLAHRVDSAGAHLTRLDSAVAEIRSEQHLAAYINCIMVRRMDPTLAPPECTPIVGAWQAR